MEKKELTNDENVKNLKKRKIIRYIIIPLYFLTIVVALADLFLQQTILLLIAIVLFLITVSLDKYRESIQIIKHDELKDIKAEMEKTKAKYNSVPIKEEKEEPKVEKVKVEKVIEKKEKKKEIKVVAETNKETKTPAKKTTTKKTTANKSATKTTTKKSVAKTASNKPVAKKTTTKKTATKKGTKAKTNSTK